jgi:hypothetical protein
MNTARLTLRSIAVLIAIAATIDPAFPLVRASSDPVVVVKLTSTPIDGAVRAMEQSLPGRAVTAREVINGRLPCASAEDCVLIADGSLDVDWGRRFKPVSMLVVTPEGEPNVRISSVAIPRAHGAAAGAARVQLEGHGVAGKRTEVRVLDGAAVIGAAAHDWTTAETATLDIPWWPIDTGTRALRIEASPIDGEITAIDNHIDIGVPIETGRIPVLIFDARPSWHSTFVRRALEDDARFAVGARSRVAPALSAGTPNGRLDEDTLDQVPLAIVGGLEALTGAEVDLLDRYVRNRGGTLVLLPERRPTGEAARLFDGVWTEHLSPTLETVGSLRATELLRATNVSPASTVLAMSGGLPVIVSSPTGAGRIVVSGAMDAWRYRDRDTSAFDRLWRSLIAQGAAAGQALIVDVDRTVAATGTRVPFTIRERRFDPLGIVEASAVARCNDGLAMTIRLWPAGSLGEFAGELPPSPPGQCTVEAAVGDRHTTAMIAIADAVARGIGVTVAKLENEVRASGGVVARAGNPSTSLRASAATIASALIASTEPMSRVVSVHPMRASWWMFPFAACLTAEWWLRRRAGLR